jgi:hypothetical protein
MFALHVTILLGASLSLGDTVGLRREMQKAAVEYERALRRHAPFRFGGSGSSCDEVVGRFCLTYDAGKSAQLPPEPEQVRKARRTVVEVFERGATHWPHDSAAVSGLVRYLVEDSLADRAIDHARRFEQRYPNSPWSHLLIGYALHAANRTVEAERAFMVALSRMDSVARVRATEVRDLLHPEEEGRYKRLRAADREAYRERLWRLADPLYLTAGNEAKAEHVARYVWTRMLARAPVVMGASSWGDDLDELTRRFGVPRARTQDYGSGLTTRITEHYDPDDMTYVPPELMTQPFGELPTPGAAWPYDTVRSRTGYAPRTLRGMHAIEHQLSRFPIGDSTELRVDAELRLDSLVTRPTRVEFGLFVLDSAFVVIAEVRDTVDASEQRVTADLDLMMPAGAYAYSVEARELGSRFAGRARHAFPLALAAGRPTVSDLVILPADSQAAPPRRGGDFTPFTSLVIPDRQGIALYLEITGLVAGADDEARYRIDLQVLEPQPDAVTRAVRGVSKALGIAQSVAPTITWTEQGRAHRVIPVALNVGVLKVKPGVRVLRVTVTDLVSGAYNRADRTVRIRRVSGSTN